MKMIFLFNMIMPLMFYVSSHPIMFMATILAQASLMCAMIWIMFLTSWFAYVLFLIFLGGLMVLFIYTTSLASNEKFEPYLYNSFFILSALTPPLVYLLYTNDTQPDPFLNKSMLLSFKEMYSFKNMKLTLLSILYLLFTLIVVVKMTSNLSGPIRNLMF